MNWSAAAISRHNPALELRLASISLGTIGDSSVYDLPNYPVGNSGLNSSGIHLERPAGMHMRGVCCGLVAFSLDKRPECDLRSRPDRLISWDVD